MTVVPGFVALDRAAVVWVERAAPGGRVLAGGAWFGADGRELGGVRWLRPVRAGERGRIVAGGPDRC